MFDAAKRVAAGKIKKGIMCGKSEQMFDKLDQNETNLADQCLFTITLIAVFDFMRFSEVSRFGF